MGIKFNVFKCQRPGTFNRVSGLRSGLDKYQYLFLGEAIHNEIALDNFLEIPVIATEKIPWHHQSDFEITIVHSMHKEMDHLEGQVPGV